VAKPRAQQEAFQADRWFTDDFRDRNAEEVSRVVDIFLRTDSSAHAAACRALGTMDSRGLLPKIAVPALVLTGEEDYATPPAMGQAVADGVPLGSARVLPSLRHLSLVEDPGLAGLSVEFLAAAGARA
jgi:3-oxoadipate enol-lactonase